MFPVVAFAEDDWDKVWENDSDIRQPVPSVTDKEFNEAYQSKLKKKKKKDPYANINAHDMSSLGKLEGSYPSVMITERFYSDEGKIIDAGHYKVVVTIPKTKNDKYYVHFFQGHTHRGKLMMHETKNDYNEKAVNYAKIIDDNGVCKFIYGNIDCNLEVVLYKAL